MLYAYVYVHRSECERVCEREQDCFTMARQRGALRAQGVFALAGGWRNAGEPRKEKKSTGNYSQLL